MFNVWLLREPTLPFHPLQVGQAADRQIDGWAVHTNAVVTFYLFSKNVFAASPAQRPPSQGLSMHWPTTYFGSPFSRLQTDRVTLQAQ